jgi:hypothetical protein
MIDQSERNSAVAVYETHSQAEAALKELQRCGFDMKRLSIVGKDYHTEEHVIGYYNAGERMKRWGKAGAFWGGMWGLLFGSAFFAIPGIGPVLVAGPLVAWMIAALDGAVMLGGLGVIGAGLFSIGIPKDSILEYESAIKAGNFVIVVHGSEVEVNRAKGIMGALSPAVVTVHGSAQRELAGSSPHRV